MTQAQKLRCYQYVNRRFEDVRELLRTRASDIFRRATTSAAARASSLDSSLHTHIGGIDVGVDVRIHVHGTRDEEGVAGMSPVMIITLGWEATHSAGFFPVMDAELSAWPLTGTETQLEINGAYRPPMGIVGKALDAAVGHRIAEATVHQFLDDVVEQIRRDIPEVR